MHALGYHYLLSWRSDKSMGKTRAGSHNVSVAERNYLILQGSEMLQMSHSESTAQSSQRLIARAEKTLFYMLDQGGALYSCSEYSWRNWEGRRRSFLIPELIIERVVAARNLQVSWIHCWKDAGGTGWKNCSISWQPRRIEGEWCVMLRKAKMSKRASSKSIGGHISN